MNPTTKAEFERRKQIAATARNPFRRAERRDQFDAMLLDYVAGRKHLFRADGKQNRNNNIGEAFWRGFDGQRFIWDVAAPLYVAYKAGVAVAQAARSLQDST